MLKFWWSAHARETLRVCQIQLAKTLPYAGGVGFAREFTAPMGNPAYPFHLSMKDYRHLKENANFVIIIITSTERRPYRGLQQVSPQRSVLCFRIQRVTATLTRSSAHLVGGLPSLRLPVCGRHSVYYFVLRKMKKKYTKNDVHLHQVTTPEMRN